jgi:hypothetical protein
MLNAFFKFIVLSLLHALNTSVSEEHLMGQSMSVCLSIKSGFSKRRVTLMTRIIVAQQWEPMPLLEHIVVQQ